VTPTDHAYWTRQAYFVARRLAPVHLVNDMVSEAMVSLVTSLRTFDPARQVCLGAFVLQRMRWAVLDALRSLRPGSRWTSERGIFYDEVELDEKHVDALPSTLPNVSTDQIDLTRAIGKLPPKRRAFMLAYLKFDDVSKAAAAVGMATETGWQHHWQAVRTLRKLMISDPPDRLK
jgi:RNA polymerase sigma factor (sigma-70 family)